MSTYYITPVAGRMPALENMPIAFVKPMQLLELMPCIKGVSTTQNHNGLLLEIAFSNTLNPEYRQALNCFRGMRPTAMRLNGRHRLMQLTVQTLTAIA